MTRKRILHWWAHVVSGLILIFFLAPALISAADTVAVILGVILLVAFGVWCWRLWFLKLLKLIGQSYNEL
jgi:hypothetical protein